MSGADTLQTPRTSLATDERGSATLETTLMIVVLLPLLFAVLEFGDALQRWLAQDAVAVQAARYAAEVGGDTPEVRVLASDALRVSGIDPARATVEISPAHVGWRQPITVSIRSEYPIALPFVYSTSLELRASAVARGEVNR